MVKVTADLRAVFTIVHVLRWGLDDINVSTLSGVCRPLDRHSRPADAGDNAVEEFEFWDEEVVQGLVPFPNLAPGLRIAYLFLWKLSKAFDILVRVRLSIERD